MYGFLVWLIILLSPLAAVAGEVPYSAIVLDLTGKATATRLGKGRPLDLGDMLYPQEEVETAAGASLTINYLESGDEEQWPGGMKFAVGKTRSDPIPPQVKRLSRKVVLPPLDSPGAGRTWAGGVSMEPPATGTIKLRGAKPLPTISVRGLANCATLQDRPTFGWFAFRGAEMYRVTLYPSGSDKPLWQQTVKETALPYPQGEPSLAWGRGYVWQVEALKAGVAVARKRSCFSLPAQPDIAPIKAQAESFGAQLAKHPGDIPTRLAFIFYLEAHHLYDEAAAQYAILRKARHESRSLSDRELRLIIIRAEPCSLTFKD
jgi:hypothetical protein